ncbi:MAG: helix-turn-helix transcriptional regulator [Clostridia bacterium]|nr:helix-turn-helix transcriptional regulator [Clostridia bacterium]
MIRLKELRLEKGLSQSELALEIETTQRNVSNWENGNSEPDIQMILKMSKFFEVNVDYFLGDKEESTYNNVENVFTEQVLLETVKSLPLAKKRALLILLQDKYI